MVTPFLFLYKFFAKRRRRLFILVLAIMGVAAFLASRIRFEEDIAKMISGGGSAGVMSQVLEQSKFLEKIIITVTSADSLNPLSPDELISAGDKLADTLMSSSFSPYISNVTYKVADTLVDAMFSLVYDNLPVFLDERDYKRLDSLIAPQQVEKAIDNSLKNLLSPASFTMKQMIIRDPVGIGGMALGKLNAYQNDENYTIVNNCVFSRDRKYLMMFVTPVYSPNQTAENSVFANKLDAAVKAITLETGNKVDIAAFGSALIAVGNAERLKKDIRLTLTITIILLALIITFSIKKKKLFPFIFLPAVFGGLLAMAVLFLIQGKVSVISLSIGTVILAITVDYALHITTHFKHRHSVIETIKDVSFPIIVCGFATAFEFLTLVFVSSESLHELGILAAISVVTAAFFTMVVMPHILEVTRSEHDETEEKNYLEKVLDKVTHYAFDKNRMLLLFMVVFTVTALFFIKRVGFETDMMKMNYMTDELRQTEDNLNRINNAKLYSVYVVAHGTDLQDALISNERLLEQANDLKNEGVVKGFSSPGSLLMSDSLQLQKIRRWNDYWAGDKKVTFLTTLEEKAVAAGFRPGSFSAFTRSMEREYLAADSTVFKKLTELFFVDNLSVGPGLATIVTVLKTDPTQKDQVIERFEGVDGVLVIDRKSVLSRLVSTLGDDFNFIANVSLLLILGVLILAFGRIELGVITFVPILLSWVWTLGFMGLFDIRFNIFNIIISSFITGLGIDYSIYIMQGLVQNYKTDNQNLLSYKTCILISVMISLSGTGVMILAKHPALHSIALISIFGLLSVVLISYTFEIIFFRYLVNKKGRKRKLPVTLTDLLSTLTVFSIFVAGCVFLNLMLLLVLLLPLPDSRKRLIMHKSMVFSCKLPVYAMPHIKKRIINLSGEDFSKPALVVSNHQSHIDLLLLLMLHPKLIVLTTRWVWNNPLYALVIRYLQYYPVMEGYGDLTAKLQQKISDGYSIIVFPEGSRSPDASITRFHKGAFLMAHQLGLDLLPVFLHGAADCMNKGENHLRGGAITVKIYPRVTRDDPRYGNDYHEMTKAMLSFYRKEYASIRRELETPSYFRKKLIRNYIYKGPVLEWYTRIKLSLEDNYQLINSIIPREASITDIGCGYGYLSLMLSFVSPGRKILGIDYDADKIELAAHCISKSDSVRFVAADAAAFEYEKSDVFVLSDVLHYLPEDKQDILLEKCMATLNPGGKIIVRDADRDLHKRHMGTRYTEFFSTRTGFNKAAENRLYFFSGSKITALAGKNGFKIETIDNTRLTSNLLYVLTRN